MHGWMDEGWMDEAVIPIGEQNSLMLQGRDERAALLTNARAVGPPTESQFAQGRKNLHPGACPHRPPQAPWTSATGSNPESQCP